MSIPLPSAWMFAAAVMMTALAIWIFLSRYKKREKALHTLLAEKERLLQSRTQELLQEQNARQLLEDRIVGEVATFSTLQGAARALTHLDPIRIQQGTIELMQSILKVEVGSIYEKDGEHFRRVAHYTAPEWSSVPSPEITTTKEPLVSLLANRKKAVSLRDLTLANIETSSMPFLALAPICVEEDTFIGFLSITKIDFMRFSSVTMQLLENLAQWVGQSYAQARKAKRWENHQLIDPQIGIFTEATLPILMREVPTGAFATLSLEGVHGLSNETVTKLLSSVASIFDPGTHILVFKGKNPSEMSVWSPVLQPDQLNNRLHQIQERFHGLGLSIPNHPTPISLRWQSHNISSSPQEP